MSKLEKAWISYDLGNSAFATTVLAAFFPLFFPEFWGKDLTSVQSASYLLWTVALSNFLLFISAPVIGALTDINGSAKKDLHEDIEIAKKSRGPHSRKIFFKDDFIKFLGYY